VGIDARRVERGCVACRNDCRKRRATDEPDLSGSSAHPAPEDPCGGLGDGWQVVSLRVGNRGRSLFQVSHMVRASEEDMTAVGCLFAQDQRTRSRNGPRKRERGGGRLTFASTLTSRRRTDSSPRRALRRTEPSTRPSGRMMPRRPPSASMSRHRATNARAGSIQDFPANAGSKPDDRRIPVAESYFPSPNGGLVRIRRSCPLTASRWGSRIESSTVNTFGWRAPRSRRFIRAFATEDAD